MHRSFSPQKRTVAVHAFGQRWRFTANALSALAPYGIGSRKSLKSVVVHLTTLNGLEDGKYEIQVYGVDLLIRVRGDQVLVDDKYAY